MITCTRKIRWEAGHRIMGHESKCAHLHGHSYCAEVTARAIDPDAAETDDIGRVVDFGVLKARLGAWIDRHWDHGFILQHKDLEARAAMEAMQEQKTYAMWDPPTAERLADHLLRRVAPALFEGTDIRIVKVTVHETANCFATAELDPEDYE